MTPKQKTILWNTGAAIGIIIAGIGGYFTAKPDPAEPKQPVIEDTFVLFAPSDGELTLQITGAETAKPGTLVILRADTNATDIQWSCNPASFNFLEIESGRAAVFCSPDGGEFIFTVSASSCDCKATSSDDHEVIHQHDHATHTLTIEGKGPQPIPKPEPDPPVPPVPTFDITGDVRGWAAAVKCSDKATLAPRLSNSYLLASEQIRLKQVTDIQKTLDEITARNKIILGDQEGAWLVGFFAELAAEMNRLSTSDPPKLKSIESYGVLFRQIAKGLEL